MNRILCMACGTGPSLEDGAAALFADGKDEEGRPLRFCSECLPLPAARVRLERRFGPGLEPMVVAVFARRLGARQ